MSGVVDLQGSVSVYVMLQVNSHYNIGHVYCLVHVTLYIHSPHLKLRNKVQAYNLNDQNANE